MSWEPVCGAWARRFDIAYRRPWKQKHRRGPALISLDLGGQRFVVRRDPKHNKRNREECDRLRQKLGQEKIAKDAR